MWGIDRYENDETSLFPSLFKKHICASPERLREDYATLLANPGYKSLLDTNLTVFGTIDDHDFGCDNGDRTYEYAYEAGSEFVNFVNEPISSPIRYRAERGLGVYGVKVFDFERPTGLHLVPDSEANIDPDMLYIDDNYGASYSNKSVAVFVLDVRTNKSPWKQDGKRLAPDYDGDFLGERQWQWFEKALKRSKASVNIVVNGLQVHPDRFPDPNVFESWNKYPLSQQRLYNLLLQEHVQAPIIISGDVHMSQLMRKDCFHSSYNSSTNFQRRTILELTTSGMTHAWGTCTNPREITHTGWYSYWTYFLSRSIMSFAHFISFHWTDLVKSSESSHNSNQKSKNNECETSSRTKLYENGGAEGATEGKQYSIELNFGELEFNWEEKTVNMRVLGVNATSPPLISAKWSLDQLSGRAPMPGSHIQPKEISYSMKNTRKLNTKNYGRNKLAMNDEMNQWTCIPYQGLPNQFQVLFGQISLFLFASLLVSWPIIFCFGIIYHFFVRSQNAQNYTLKKI